MASSGGLVGPIVTAEVCTGKHPVVGARLPVDELRDRSDSDVPLSVTERVEVPEWLSTLDGPRAAQLRDRG
ncbi:hypothetical protein PlfCFBP13513_07055 [Plantibacter flavus]|nr:hypothetical protein PlfCFBP13513_07055 [Plantibacter flavus]